MPNECNKRLDRTVAVKVLPEHIAKREDLRARFVREARAVASLNAVQIIMRNSGVTFTTGGGRRILLTGRRCQNLEDAPNDHLPLRFKSADSRPGDAHAGVEGRP